MLVARVYSLLIIYKNDNHLILGASARYAHHNRPYPPETAKIDFGTPSISVASPRASPR